MFIKVCAIAILCSVVLVLLKRLGSSVSFAVGLCSCVLFGIVISGSATSLISWVNGLRVIGEPISKYALTVLKATGIALLASFCAQICRDCGENSAAKGVELAARCEILLLSVPLAGEIIEVGVQLLEMV